MTASQKPTGRWIVIACLFAASILAISYFWGANSEAFQFVEKSIRSSQTLEQKIGRVEQVSLDPFGGYREKFANADKAAFMSVNVTGVKGEVTIEITAKKSDGAWHIKSAAIDGQSIALE